MEFYKHIEGDTFQRIRDDDELGEKFTFIRDSNGLVIKAENHGNYFMKLK